MYILLIELSDNKLSNNKLSNNKLSNNKLSDNNLAGELVENRTFFKPITIEEIVIFTIKLETGGQRISRKHRCKVTKLKSKFYLLLR